MKNQDLFYPDVDEYLALNTRPITSTGLEEYILRVCAATGMSKTIASQLTIIFFEEIRYAMLRGDIVTLRGLGKFTIANPKNNTSKRKVFAKFKPYKSFIGKMNK